MDGERAQKNWGWGGTYISLSLPMMAYLWNLNRKQWIISRLIRGNPASLRDKFE